MSDGVGVKLSFEALLGQVSAGLGSLNDTLGKLHRFMSVNPLSTPISRPIFGSAVNSGNVTYVFMDLGGPSAGWVREVRWFTTWGADPFATLSSVAVVGFIAGAGQYPDSSIEPAGFTELTAISAAVPNRFTATAGELTIPPGRHLILCFKGLGSGIAVNAYGQAWDRRESTLVAEPV